MKKLLKSKTFWGGVGSLLTAAAGYATGTMPAATAVQTAVTALLAIFLRDGLAKLED